jgi:hypothetical protein
MILTSWRLDLLLSKLSVDVHDECLVGCLVLSLFFGLGRRISDLLHNSNKPTTSMSRRDSIKRLLTEGIFIAKISQYLNPLNTKDHYPQAWIICMLNLPTLYPTYPWTWANVNIISPHSFKMKVQSITGCTGLGESSFRAGGATHLVSIGFDIDMLILHGR